MATTSRSRTDATAGRSPVGSSHDEAASTSAATTVKAARKRSFSSRVPMVTRTPSPGKGRLTTPRFSKPRVSASAALPAGNQTKFA
jgi:hypothetical protein